MAVRERHPGTSWRAVKDVLDLLIQDEGVYRDDEESRHSCDAVWRLRTGGPQQSGEDGGSPRQTSGVPESRNETSTDGLTDAEPHARTAPEPEIPAFQEDSNEWVTSRGLAQELAKQRTGPHHTEHEKKTAFKKAISMLQTARSRQRAVYRNHAGQSGIDQHGRVFRVIERRAWYHISSLSEEVRHQLGHKTLTVMHHQT